MINILRNYWVVLFVLLFSMDMSYSDDKYAIWTFPISYPDLLEKSQKGDRQAQEEISKLIYKGIMRYPSGDKKDDSILFAWLREVNDDDSFERKIARLFFMRGTAIDSQNTYTEIKEKAARGDPYAQRSMGSLYFYTELVEDSPKEGMAWYLKAAKQGHARAQMSLALRYLGGHHTNKNIPEGMKWLELASDSGLPEAQQSLSTFYLLGKHVSKDITKAFNLLVSATKGGDIVAQKNLALFHLGIIDVKFPALQNTTEGMFWLKKASSSGELEAMLLYADYCINGKYVKKNSIKGLEILKKAGELGNVTAFEEYQRLVKENDKA